MAAPARPLSALLFAALLVMSSLAMVFLGLMAAGYFVPVFCLMLAAALVWLGRGRPLLISLAVINQLSGLVLVLDLWLGGGLGDLKLDISGVALLLNLATGGPLMALISLPLLGTMRFGAVLPRWFQARGA